ncbi:MAG: GNAT family N-acetyltransferase [Acidimicrobiales bacterium]
MRWAGPNGYWASDEPELVDVEWVHRSLSAEAYWALGRSYEVVARSIEHSLVFGLYSGEGAEVGVARVVTDFATFGWLCDVYVDPVHTGHGLGSFLVETVISHPALQGLRLVLAAVPGRTLYARQGFVPLPSPDHWMERRSSG